jgi:hypothetical protein
VTLINSDAKPSHTSYDRLNPLAKTHLSAMARNLIPELERLKDESEQDNTWLRRQKSDVGLLKSPWRSPGWKKERPFDGDKSVPEVSQLRSQV